MYHLLVAGSACSKWLRVENYSVLLYQDIIKTGGVLFHHLRVECGGMNAENNI